MGNTALQPQLRSNLEQKHGASANYINPLDFTFEHSFCKSCLHGVVSCQSRGYIKQD